MPKKNFFLILVILVTLGIIVSVFAQQERKHYTCQGQIVGSCPVFDTCKGVSTSTDVCKLECLDEEGNLLDVADCNRR